MAAAVAFPPALDADEREILRGGFGGIAWIYTGIVAAGLAATIVLVPLAAWFWLRSSRFVLTDRRLVWKPRIGKARQIAVEQLRGAAVTIGTATGTVRVDGPSKVRLRWQRDVEKAWGALLLFAHWSLPPQGTTTGAGWDLAAQTVRRGPRQQGGLTVVSGELVAFLPISSGTRTGEVGKTAALAVVGLREAKTRAEFPVFALVQALHARGGDFGHHVATLAATLDGLVWSLPSTQRRRWKHGLEIAFGDDRLEIQTDEARAARFIGP